MNINYHNFYVKDVTQSEAGGLIHEEDWRLPHPPSLYAVNKNIRSGFNHRNISNFNFQSL